MRSLYDIHADAEAMRFWHEPPHKHPTRRAR
jgi:hypothetical protein